MQDSKTILELHVTVTHLSEGTLHPRLAKLFGGTLHCLRYSLTKSLTRTRKDTNFGSKTLIQLY